VTRVTIQDVRAARYCLCKACAVVLSGTGSAGRLFSIRGLRQSSWRATGDALVDPVIDAAIAREAYWAGKHPLNAQDTSHGGSSNSQHRR